MAARDKEFLAEYLESNFADKLLNSLDLLEESGYTVG